jgi:hypothetical protein
MAVNPNTDFSPGQVLTAGQQNRFPRGVLGYASSGVGYTTTATHTTFQDTGLAANVTYGANRILKVTYATHAIANGGVQGVSYRFLRGSTVLRLMEVTASVFPNTSNAFNLTLEAIFVGPSASATESFKVQIAAATANTSVIDYGDSQRIRQFCIEDLGPA